VAPSFTDEQVQQLEALIAEGFAPLKTMAEELGVEPRELAARLARHGLNDRKEMGRPKKEGDLVPLIDKHAGCLERMAEELGITRQAVTSRLRTRDLLDYARGVREAAARSDAA
jgi:Mn-dependent DtxR family transcriptional regulator